MKIYNSPSSWDPTAIRYKLTYHSCKIKNDFLFYIRYLEQGLDQRHLTDKRLASFQKGGCCCPTISKKQFFQIKFSFCLQS